MIIRKLSEVDIPALRELAVRIYRDTFSVSNTEEDMEIFINSSYSLESFGKEFKEENSHYFFVEDRNVPVGFSRLRKNDEVTPLLGENTIELQRLYVDANHQNKRIGSLLMQHAIDFAKEIKVEWLWLGVWEHNPKAQRFYARWGFERFSEHVFHMGNDVQTDWLLKKKIG